jgi:hypothetical protein
MDDKTFEEATGFDKEEIMSNLVWFAYEIKTKSSDVCEEKYGIPLSAPDMPTQMN